VPLLKGMSMPFSIEKFTFFLYFAVVLVIAYLTTQKQKSDQDFVIGNRSLNFWLTALSAHASDMSSWLFLAYPSMIFCSGIFEAWAAVGLTLFMFLNWHFIAPRIRHQTEKMNSLTLNSYFEARFEDNSGWVRIISATMSILFFTVYISSGLVSLGILAESLFHLPYATGISFGLAIVVIYVFAGGYKTVAYIDLFQGFFLLGVIVFIPTLLIYKFGGLTPIFESIRLKHLSASMLPDMTPKTIWAVLMTMLTWGLGYFGQPHIITKFMGIQKVSEMYKAKILGITWQTIALTSATLIGLICIHQFPLNWCSAQDLQKSQQVSLELVKQTLPPAFSGLALCAILAATTNVMAAQILVVASNLSEDFYKHLFNKSASSDELLKVSRASVLIISFIAFLIAAFKVSSIYELVLYAWSGLGASFGPLILLSLYMKKLNRVGAFAGILIGGTLTILADLFQWGASLGITSMVLGFTAGLIAIPLFSKIGDVFDKSTHFKY
jgi:sodium/proline symporter